KAAEMIVIRLAYASDLPDPADLIRKLKDQPVGNGNGGGTMYASAPQGIGGGGAQAALAAAPHTEDAPVASIRTLEDVVAVLEQQGSMILASQVYQFVHLIRI